MIETKGTVLLTQRSNEQNTTSAVLPARCHFSKLSRPNGTFTVDRSAHHLLPLRHETVYQRILTFRSVPSLTFAQRQMHRVTVLLLAVFIRCSQQTSYSCDPNVSCGCSRNSASVNRIVGGETASEGTWSWTVSLSISQTYLCGGSIISSTWVITAAHCVIGKSASEVTAYAGGTKRSLSTQTRVGAQIIVHPNYDSDTSANDIALIRLSTPLTMTGPDVDVICLPSVSQTALNAGEWPSASSSVSTR